MSFDPGDVWTPELTVKDAADVLTAATVSATVTSPSGVVTTPTPSTATTGIYTAYVPLTEAGRWLATWTVSGAVTGVETQSTYVRRLGSNVIGTDQVKARLNKSLNVDDPEIDEMLDAALAEYEQWVGPVSGEQTETLAGGRDTLILRTSQPATLTGVTYWDGTVVDVADLAVQNGLVTWGYGTTGRFWTGQVTVTYTVGGLPANHREAIIADVAGYFAATQRGPAGLPGEGYEAAFTATPLTLFPRIRALAVPSIA